MTLIGWYPPENTHTAATAHRKESVLVLVAKKFDQIVLQVIPTPNLFRGHDQWWRVGWRVGQCQLDRCSSAAGSGDRRIGSGTIDAQYVIVRVLEADVTVVNVVSTIIASRGDGGDTLCCQLEERLMKGEELAGVVFADWAILRYPDSRIRYTRSRRCE
jgi:hypothetical protein